MLTVSFARMSSAYCFAKCRRMKLFDMVAAQYLIPMVGGLQLACCRGIAISRTCESMLALGEVLRDSSLRAIVKDILEKAVSDFMRFKPFL